MLFLVFSIGDENYALAAGDVVEVLPLMPLRRVHGAPHGMAGSFAYRGGYIPAIDLSELARGQPAAARRSTRLVVAKLDDGRDGKQLVGLIAENATDILRCDPAAFAPFANAGPRGLVQRLELERLAPASLLAALSDTMATAA